jgi:hypothetical protein
MDRDANALLKTFSRGFAKRKLGQSEEMSSESLRSLCSHVGCFGIVDGKRVRERASHGLSDAV